MLPAISSVPKTPHPSRTPKEKSTHKSLWLPSKGEVETIAGTRGQNEGTWLFSLNGRDLVAHMGPPDNQRVTIWEDKTQESDSAEPAKKRTFLVCLKEWNKEPKCRLYLVTNGQKGQRTVCFLFFNSKKNSRKWANGCQALLRSSHPEKVNLCLFQEGDNLWSVTPKLLLPVYGGVSSSSLQREDSQLGVECCWWDRPPPSVTFKISSKEAKAYKTLHISCYHGSQLKSWISSLHEMGKIEDSGTWLKTEEAWGSELRKFPKRARKILDSLCCGNVVWAKLQQISKG